MANSSDTPHYENVPFEVPENWEWTTLGEIGTWQSGATPSRLRKDYYGGNIPWLKTGDLNDGLITDIPEFITQKALDETSVKLNPIGSILIAMYGATIGKIGILTFPATTNQACCACSDYKIEQMYLFYFLLANKKVFIAMGGGGAQPNISKEKIAVTFMPLPPLTEQQRIVVEIERWFKLIDAIDQSKADLQTTITQTKSKILDLAIHGKLVPQDPNDEPASELLKRINPKAEITCDNEHYPKLPKGWSITSMQEVCGLFDGERQEDRLLTSLDAKFLRGFSDGKVIKAGRYVPANTYMILVDGENSGEVFQTSTEGYQGSTFKQLNINENMNEKFVLDIINLHRKSLRENKVGSAIPHLNKKLFKAIPVPIPPYAEQERIIDAINAAYALLTVIEENL
ncbi:restriction endonuclease subunit S [Hallella seregens]|uniref:Restriction endonuclease subunit S n=1 Tax=Hallella seregens ATCC 51272 TaxID=1336250 RepID=A0ABV5ZQ97_9BACT|nr:restriction endonuclease subunit S [Hallella seregens]